MYFKLDNYYIHPNSSRNDNPMTVYTKDSNLNSTSKTYATSLLTMFEQFQILNIASTMVSPYTDKNSQIFIQPGFFLLWKSIVRERYYIGLNSYY